MTTLLTIYATYMHNQNLPFAGFLAKVMLSKARIYLSFYNVVN